MMAPERSGVFLFEDVVVDSRRFEVRRQGERIELEPKALRVLLHLIEHRDRVVTREELIGEIWAGTFVTDNALTRVIAQIRKQLGDNARSPRFIETVATTGYRFVADAIEESAAEPEPAPPPAPLLKPPPPWWGWWAPAAFAGIAAIAIAAWWLGRAHAGQPAHFTGFQQLTSSTAADLWPAFSPDGGQIAFSSNRTGRFEIYVRSLAPGSAERQLTTDGGDNVQPVWRPNGQEIAFVSERRGAIAVVPVSGGVPRYLAAVSLGQTWSPYGFSNAVASPDWSPDGRMLVYSAGAVGKIHLWRVGLDDSEPRPVTQSGTPPGDHRYAKWLADGRHVVFSAFFPTLGHPWVVDVETGELQAIQVAADTVLFPCWPRNGRYLYFATRPIAGVAVPTDPAAIWRARIDSHWRAEKPELLIPFSGEAPQDLAVTADGSRIAITQTHQESALWSLPLDHAALAAGDPKPLVRDGGVAIAEPNFSPDGSKLAFASMRQGGDWTILVAGADGSSPTPITPGGQSHRNLSWVGNDALAYVGDQQGNRSYWIAPFHGPPRRVNLKLDLGPYAIVKMSPRGDRVVAHSGNRKVGIKLALFDLATGQSRDLTPPGRTFVFPSWSPDGRWISAVERIDPNFDHLVAIEVATGKIQNLADAPDDPSYFSSYWAPDSDRIAFSGLREGIANLYWASRSTGKVQQVTHFDSQNETVLFPAWSPKGDRLVFQYVRFAANLYAGELRD